MKKILAILLSISFILAAMSVTVNAADSFDKPTIEFIFDEGTSTEIQERIIADFTNEDDGAVTYGLTCTIFGHNIETGYTSTVTHKARATDPRCLKETFSYEICSRCDYSEYTLVASSYISCC